MYVKYVFRDDDRFPPPSEDAEQKAGKIPIPNWNQIEEVVLALDGRHSSFLFVGDRQAALRETVPPSGHGLIVEGVSSDGWYCVHGLTRDMTEESCLLNLENKNLPFQEAYYFGLEQPIPAIACVTLDQVLSTLKSFAETGSVPADSQWMPIREVEKIG